VGVLLAKAAGARGVVTSSSDDKLAQMRELGVELKVKYRRNPEGRQEVATLTGSGADVILENVGRPTLDQSMIASAPQATIVLMGIGPLLKALPSMPSFSEKTSYRKLLLMAADGCSRTC